MDALNRCLGELPCDEMRSYVTLRQAGSLEFPCAALEKQFILHCSGTPEAMACIGTCGRRASCGGDETFDHDACGVGCLEDGWQKARTSGTECWNRNVMYNICLSQLSCDQTNDVRTKRDSPYCAEQRRELDEGCAVRPKVGAAK